MRLTDEKKEIRQLDKEKKNTHREFSVQSHIIEAKMILQKHLHTFQ